MNHLPQRNATIASHYLLATKCEATPILNNGHLKKIINESVVRIVVACWIIPIGKRKSTAEFIKEWLYLEGTAKRSTREKWQYQFLRML